MNDKFSLAISGILLIILGVICIANPIETIESLAWLIGLIILVAGALRLYLAIRANRLMPVRKSRFISAGVLIVAGILIMASPLFTTRAITVIVSLYLLVEGFVILVQSISYRKAGFRLWYCLFVLGLLLVAIGTIGTGRPDKLVSVAGMLMGIAILLNGVAYIIALAGLSRLDHFDDAEELE